jgi:hypothetical protein
MPYNKVIKRESGEFARILITNYAQPGAKPDVGVDVFRKKQDSNNWDLCTQSHEEKKASMAMSVHEYIKNGRHPMFSAVTTAELLKAGIEAKCFGYTNPHVEAVLHVKDDSGSAVSIPVEVDSGKGMIESQSHLDGLPSSEGQYLTLNNERFEIESNGLGQARVTDLAGFQDLVVRNQLRVDRDAEESRSPR